MEDPCRLFHRNQTTLQRFRYASTHRWPNLRYPALGIGHHWFQTELHSCAAQGFWVILECANSFHNTVARSYSLRGSPRTSC